MPTLTPMLKQYMLIKNRYPDAILFYRMGDFYEMFFDDAVTASRILGITLTARGVYNGKKVPMCGVPHHASRGYVAKLLARGWKVAVCEQTEDPKASKGIVNRDVVRVVTPGSIIDEGDLDDKSNLYMAAVCGEGGPFGLAHLDLSTGDFQVTQLESFDALMDELGRIDPAEVVLPEHSDLSKNKAFALFRVELIERHAFDPKRAEDLLKKQLDVPDLDRFGCRDMPQAVVAAGALVHYLHENQKSVPEHIKEMVLYHVGDFMFLDEVTRSHLELLRTMRRRSEKGALCQVLDRTATPMGGRLLKKWIAYPLINPDRIRERLGAVTCLKDDPMLRMALREELKQVYDMERLNGRVALGRANARDLLALKVSIGKLPHIKSLLKDTTSILLSHWAARLDTLEDVAETIAEAIHEDPPASLKDGGIIREGYDEALDRLIAMSRDGKSWISDFAASEQKRTGISSLKVGFNKVFGYYIEVSRANLHLIPSDYMRKQTLVNGERYITEPLKIKEEQVLGAEDKRVALELEIFERIRSEVCGENQRIKETSEIIAQIDVLSGLAEVAETHEYVCPTISTDGSIHIIDGRHPVIESTVKEEDFVPNDIHMDRQAQQVLIITGPNMAGKSTILRQTALIVLMAQMGSYVPASEARIGLVDRIFTRVGASDDLSRGQSTFMVEMTETANILRHASPRSLVILDEIGRGTSTYDGLSIAWAVAEALHDREDTGVRTLFATHYHELTELAATKSRVKNFNIAVREWKEQIIFLRKLVPGGASRSYGIQVARIAGLPDRVIGRAKEILGNLEATELDGEGRPRLAQGMEEKGAETGIQLGLFGAPDTALRVHIRNLDIPRITPLEALVELNRLQKIVKDGEG